MSRPASLCYTASRGRCPLHALLTLILRHGKHHPEGRKQRHEGEDEIVSRGFKKIRDNGNVGRRKNCCLFELLLKQINWEEEGKDKAASFRLTSFLPDPDVPSSRLAPEDSEPWDSRRPLLPEKSEKQHTLQSSPKNDKQGNNSKHLYPTEK